MGYIHVSQLQLHLFALMHMQACGQWDKALEVAEKNDRIHLKCTHYAYAQVSSPKSYCNAS